MWGVIIPVVGLALLAGSGLARRCTLIPGIRTCTVLQCGRFFHRYDAVGFSGLESACANTDVVENPERNVPSRYSAVR